MNRTILEESPGAPGLVRLTVDQYERMVQQGILPDGEPIELLDGLLVRKDRARAGGNEMTVSPGHQTVIARLIRLAPAIEPFGSHLRIQGPIRIGTDHEPEPDGAVVRGQLQDYTERHPEAGDVISVIEVADSSLHRDRTTKMRIYARAGIPQYIVINLAERQVEVYCSPSTQDGTYSTCYVRRPDQHVDIAVGPSTYLREPRVLAQDLLP